jgi:outer membrane protein OmpA-like peptidoglycan-associated protein
MSETDLLDPPPARPLWLWTLADLALLLVGFFVLVQATDRQALAKGLREGFGGKPATTTAISTPADPIPLASAAAGFAPGSAKIVITDGLLDFAMESLRDPRVTLRIAGSAEGTHADSDPTTGSAQILASDRARATASWLIAHGVAADRIMIATPGTGRRIALVTMSFTGDPVRKQP